ncbi:MAG: hypothetical protein RR636_04500 [Clostridium sp.]
MDSFNDYKFANVTDEEQSLLKNLEKTMSKDGQKELVLIAYENKNSAEG